jgi:hypothetical protein
MNDMTKIDIRGSITDAASETGKDMIGLFVVAIIFGFLFAPWFSPFFKSHFEEKYKHSHWAERPEIIKKEMEPINRTLWTISIISWIIVIIVNIAYHS